MKQTVSNAKKALIFAIALVIGSGVYFLTPGTRAATITNRSVTITDSRPSESDVEYIFEGTFSDASVQCIEVQFCENASGTCTVSSINVSGADKGTAANWGDPFTHGSWTAGTPDNTNKIMTFTPESGENPDGAASFAIGGLTNPTSAGTNFARINTYGNPDCSTSPQDEGVVAFAIVDGVTVTADVAETLTFTISESSLGFGEINTSDIRWATSNGEGSGTEPANGAPSVVTLSTNAANGATVTVQGEGNGTNAGLYGSNSEHLISAVAPSAVDGGTEGVAVYGKNVGEAGGASLSLQAGFGVSGGTALTRSAQSFVTADGAIDAGVVDLTLKAGISGTTPADSYQETLVLIATPSF